MRNVRKSDLSTRLVIGFIAALIALIAAPARAEAGCGMGNQCAVVDSVTTAPGPGTVTVTCSAHDPDGLVTKLTFTASAGSFSNGTNTIDVTPAASAQSVSASTPWNAVAGATLSCAAWDSGGGFTHTPTKGPALTVTYNPPANPPVIDSVGADNTTPLVGQTVKITGAAHDPLGQALTATWSTTGGGLWTDGTDPFTTRWTAPGQPGVFQVALTVRNSSGVEATSTVVLTVGWATAGTPILSGDGATMVPARMATDPAGNLYVGDTHGRMVRGYTPQGGLLRSFAVPGRPGGIAVGTNGDVWVADLERGRVGAYDALGVERRVLGVGDMEFQGPLGIAIDPGNKRVYVTDADAQIIKMYDEGSGALIGIILVPDSFAVSLAFDPQTSELYVGDSRHGNVRVLSANGVPLRTIGSFGGGAGKLTRVGGITLAPDGSVYVVDSFQSQVAVFSRTGVFTANIGSLGSAPGQVQVPVDAAANAFGQVLVSSAESGRIEVFKLTGARATVCAGDSDCDGMPDWWEIANGLNPFDPRDAYLDSDGDGLVNLAEYRLHTNPNKADTDGDGILDGAEVAAGFDPLDAADNRPVADPGEARTSDPALVTLDGRGSYDPNGDGLEYAWEQVTGPASVEIEHAGTAEPTAVLRKAGDYVFRLRVNDGHAWSEWRGVQITVREVAPTADAGRTIPAKAGSTVTLDGRFSSDANGDLLAYSWVQVAGPKVALQGATTAEPSFQPTTAGLYTFELVVGDGLSQSEPSRTHVLVASAGNHPPTAAAPALVEGVVGAPITLDGSASADSDEDGLAYTWAQIDGPPVALSGKGPVATFPAAEPGVYRFALTVSDGTHESLPAVSTVVVDHPQDHVPRARIAAPQRADTLTRITLDCGGSTDADADEVSCSWKQTGGARVALDLDRHTAAFTPIDGGTYTFELEVADPEGVGTRDTVTIVVDDPRVNAVPTADAHAGVRSQLRRPREPAPLFANALLHPNAAPHSLLFVSSSGSTDPNPGDVLRYTWTQVSGPMIELSDARAAAATFRPLVAGTYVFELQVDDGKARSPAVRTQITVAAPPVSKSPASIP